MDLVSYGPRRWTKEFVSSFGSCVWILWLFKSFWFEFYSCVNFLCLYKETLICSIIMVSLFGSNKGMEPKLNTHSNKHTQYNPYEITIQRCFLLCLQIVCLFHNSTFFTTLQNNLLYTSFIISLHPLNITTFHYTLLFPTHTTYMNIHFTSFTACPFVTDPLTAMTTSFQRSSTDLSTWEPTLLPLWTHITTPKLTRWFPTITRAFHH